MKEFAYLNLIKVELTNTKLNDHFSFDPETKEIWFYDVEKVKTPHCFKHYKDAKFFYLFNDSEPTKMADTFFATNKRAVHKRARFIKNVLIPIVLLAFAFFLHTLLPNPTLLQLIGFALIALQVIYYRGMLAAFTIFPFS